MKKYGQDKYNSSASKIANLKKDIEKYKDRQNEQKDMARKTFKCKKIEYYNNNGRVKSMVFEET